MPRAGLGSDLTLRERCKRLVRRDLMALVETLTGDGVLVVTGLASSLATIRVTLVGLDLFVGFATIFRLTPKLNSLV